MHPHGVHGPAASAVAATLLRGGSADELARAFLLASSLPMAATLAAPMEGASVRNVWTGLGAYYGACASAWAASGAAATADVFPALFDAAVATDLSGEQLVGDLGNRWQIASSYLKPYACARWIHPTLDAALAAASGFDFSPQDVQSIEVDTFAFAASLGTMQVRSDLHARFSLPYCLATLLTDGELYAESFLPGLLHRPEVATLASRTVVTENPAYSAALPHERPAHVTLRLRDGQSLTAEVRTARGDPSSPLSRGEVETKFRRNVGDVVSGRSADMVVAGLLDGRPNRSTTLAALASELLRDLRI